jgi:peptidoglycan-N-acetylglucosamine deacetylase
VRSSALLTVFHFNGWLPVVAMVCSMLYFARLTFVVVGAVAHRRLEAEHEKLTYWPESVAVIIPAYNEAEVICRTIKSVLATGRSDLEVIVVDDGPSDGTSEVARAAFEHDPRVRIFKKPNGGKAAAANFALQQTNAEVVVAIDADTIIAPDAIPLLVRHFEDSNVGAVAGMCEVGNRVNLLTRVQWLEYRIGQSLDRRALTLFNANGIVPGAIGAWRRTHLIEAGAYKTDTLAEDADATFRVILEGKRVLFEPRAYAFTEAPETARAFLKQRNRWMFGMLQVTAKHLGEVWKGSPIGLITIPNIIYQYSTTILIPCLDIIATSKWVVSFVVAKFSSEGGIANDMTGNNSFLCLWLCFHLMDLVFSVAAMRAAGLRDAISLAPLLFAQRLLYWPMMYWTAMATLFAAAKGTVGGWNKLRRTGAVSCVFGTGPQLVSDLP